MTNGGASETNGIPSENNGDALLNCPNCGGGGKLTEEDVQRALFAHSTYASYDGLQLYASGIRTQEIADELNATLGEVDDDECYLVYEGKKYPAELDFGFLGMMPITITVGGFRYLVEGPNGE